MNTPWSSRSRNSGGDDDEPDGIISLGRPRVVMVSSFAFVRGAGGGICRRCFNPTTQLLSEGLCAGCGGSILPPLTVPHDHGR